MKKFFTHTLPYAIIFWLFASLILVYIGDKLVMPFIAGHHKDKVNVPELVNVDAKEAEALLLANGLNFSWRVDGKYSSEIAKGKVLHQLPTAGREVKIGRNIVLTVSLGLREVDVPELRGRSKRQAEISLQRLGLKKGKDIQGAHSSIPQGVVIRSIPPAGDKARIGEIIDLVISSGKTKGRTKLPVLTGISISEAKTILDSLNFTLGEIEKISDSLNVPNTVLSHDPKHGEYLDSGTVIRFQIAE